MTLSIEQLIALASAAGFTGADLATAVAIALAESGGNPQAYNPEGAAGAAQGHGSYGLWQIYLTAHPEYTAAQLLDPAQNAQAAFAVYSQAGGNFRPWSTFKNGAYLAGLDGVNQTIAALQSPDPTASGGTDTTASSQDPRAGSGGPDQGTLVSLVVFGALGFWALLRIANG